MNGKEACKYEYDENTGRLRINCLGCMYGASIEDNEACMSRVIDLILSLKNVSSVVLAKEREYEYSGKQVEMLVEIANVINEIIEDRLISYSNLGPDECLRCYPDLPSRLQYIVINLMRRDPIGAYVEITREIRKINIRMEKHPACYKCLKRYKNEILEILRIKLEKTRLIQLAKPHLSGYHIGDRSLYRHIFMPAIRPNFMLTRFMVTPPENAIFIERYSVGDVNVEIYKMKHSAEYFYYAIPPEFTLDEEKYSVLDAARRYMAAHQPKTPEFVRSERVREMFFNIGRDMIRDVAKQMNATLTTKDIEQLATILTRYTAGLGVLEVLLMDNNVQDVYVNSPVELQPIMIFHSNYEECKTNLMPTHEDAESWATRLRIQSGRPLDESNPVLDTEIEIPGGRARFAVVTRTLSPYGLGFAIRRHRDMPWTLPLFLKAKMMSPLAAGLLSFLADGAVSMLIAGGRGAGKTSLLSAVILELLPKTRIVTIEDTLELPITHFKSLDYNIESLKSRSVITMIETEMPADEALRTALRLGDSALIIGEVRSTEARALYEAMRIGALSNLVAGTIHGESAYGVYDRVVNDLGVPKTSFKATDIVVIAKTLRSADGLHRFRRLVEVTEIRKHWDEDPLREGGFVNLMEYSGKEDQIKPTDTFTNGESEILNRIASYVREWSGNWQAVWENINLRGNIKKTIVEYADKLGKPELMEAKWNVRSNVEFHLIAERLKNENGYADPKEIY
ncbi:MAG TPA: hypothetical protein ENG42_01570, partial [Candidatus Aenigmarchaeota archaeon]|nr:hypothetical protein [Candidatus Aenigmarchaeota archaeon]